LDRFAHVLYNSIYFRLTPKIFIKASIARYCILREFAHSNSTLQWSVIQLNSQSCCSAQNISVSNTKLCGANRIGVLFANAVQKSEQQSTQIRNCHSTTINLDYVVVGTNRSLCEEPQRIDPFALFRIR